VAHSRREYVHCLRSNGKIPLECGNLNKMDKHYAPTHHETGHILLRVRICESISKEKGRVPKDAGQIVANSADYPDYGIQLILRIVEIFKSFNIAHC